MGGVLFIGEACYMYRPDIARGYGQEAMEILLQVREDQREDVVVIPAGYAMLARQNRRLNPAAQEAMTASIARRRTRPYFSNARSIRNALDRARLRQAGPLMAIEGPVPREALMLIESPDTLANRAFGKAAATEAGASSHGDAA